jgi:WD40 repeat protein
MSRLAVARSRRHNRYSIDIYCGDTYELLGRLKDHKHEIDKVKFSPDGTKLVSMSHSTIRLWDLKTFQQLLWIEVQEECWVQQANFDSSGWYLSVISRYCCRKYDLSIQEYVGYVEECRVPDSYGTILAHTAAGFRVIDRYIKGSHYETSVIGMSGEDNVITQRGLRVDRHIFEMSPTENQFIMSVSSEKATLTGWNLPGSEIAFILEHSVQTCCAVYSSTGTAIASLDRSNRVHIWSAVYGTRLRSFCAEGVHVLCAQTVFMTMNCEDRLVFCQDRQEMFVCDGLNGRLLWSHQRSTYACLYTPQIVLM